jgi:tRNA wybutosine-synthesizing protein 4
LEQILPDGIDHPFARTMMAHFDKLQTPLRAVQKYPTVVAQEERFKGLGWNMASACNLWRLWNDLGFINSRERISLDMLEPFDEWEEFALFGCHYFLLVADNTSNLPNCEAGKDLSQYPENGSVTRDGIRTVKVEMVYAENPKAQGRRRFAAVLPLRGSRRTQDRVGLFAGMGLNTRINTYDVYANNLEGDFISNSPAGSVVPSSRMCHTITDLGESGAILVGGRTSPDNALAECWLYHKWLDTWERVDDLPQPRYRHGAVNLGNGYILISPGKSNSRDISGDFYVWSRALGWTKCIQGPGENPVASYGATFTTLGKLLNIRGPTRGLLAGGMSEDALFLEDVWEWEILDPSDEVSKFHLPKPQSTSLRKLWIIPLTSIFRNQLSYSSAPQGPSLSQPLLLALVQVLPDNRTRRGLWAALSRITF